MPLNDNDESGSSPLPEIGDAHGQAALVLVESLIHGLVERSVLTIPAAVEIIDTAVEVQSEVAEAADGAGAPMWRSHALLTAMATSLRRDIDGAGVAGGG